MKTKNKDLKGLEKENLERRELRMVVLSVRVTKLKSKWLKQNKVSPSELFNKALDYIIKAKK